MAWAWGPPPLTDLIVPRAAVPNLQKVTKGQKVQDAQCSQCSKYSESFPQELELRISGFQGWLLVVVVARRV